MSLINRLKKWYLGIVHPKDITEVSRVRQEEFLHRLGEPTDPCDRVYMKYRSRNFLLDNKTINIFMNLVSACILPFLWITYRVRGHGLQSRIQRENDLLLLRSDALYPDTSDIFPEELNQRFSKVIATPMKNYKAGYLDKEADRLFLRCLRKHPFLPYMQLVTLCNLADACQLVHKYQPAAIATFAEERVFAKPLVKELLSGYGVEYIGFMHGESYYQIDKGHFCYDIYYVWDDYYSELYSSLQCEAEYRTYLPKKLQLSITQKKQEECEFFCTYYMVGITSPHAQRKIAEVYQAFAKAGFQCKIRPHPRYAQSQELADLFPDAVIEDARKVSIRDSLDSTYFVISTCSTVLSEAYYAGKKTVIDDFSNPQQYQKIVEKGYIMLSKADMLLSELMDCIASGVKVFDSFGGKR